MKAILTTLVLTCLVITTHVRAGNDSIVAKAPEKASFYASASSLNGDSIRFLILNPGADDVVIRNKILNQISSGIVTVKL